MQGNKRAASAAPTTFASIDDWIAREAIPFSFDNTFDAAVDRIMKTLGDQVSVLGIGEALHGGEEFLILRNRLFQRLVEAHGFTAITLETHDPRARLVDAYISGRGAASYEAIADAGFSYGSGRYDANRELVEWMKRFNAGHEHQLGFYGTLPSEQGETTESPRQALELALAYLASVDPAGAARHRDIVEPLLGANADWEVPAAAIQKELMARLMSGADAPTGDREPGFGVSPRAQALRLAVEHLAYEFHMRRPELVGSSRRASFDAALHDLSVARNLLALHEALARRDSLGTLVSMRDAMAAEHLVSIADREAPRGKLLVHLHASHLRRTKTKLPWYELWPTGAYLDLLLGPRFAVIGGAVGTSEANFIGPPEPGSLEAHLLARGSDCFVPVSRATRLPQDELTALPERTGSTQPWVPYSPLSAQSLADLDAVAFLRSVTYTRGAAPLPG